MASSLKFRPELLEEVREKVKQVFLTIVTAVFLAVAANLVAAYFAIMFPSYLALMIFVAVLVMTASVLVMTRTLLLPYSTLRTNAHCDLFYNEEGPLEFPSDYSPQNYAKQLVKMCCKKNDTLWNRLMEAPGQLSRTLHKKHPFTDVVEFLLLLWMAHEASTPTITLELEEKVTPLTQFKIRPKGGNVLKPALPPFLTTLSHAAFFWNRL